MLALSLLLLAISTPIAVVGQRLESSECAAFSTDGLAASQFQYYRFYDFRNVGKGSDKRKHNRRRGSPARNRTVSDDSWRDDWYVRDFPRKSPGGHSIPVNFIPERVEIGKRRISKLPVSHG